MKFEMVERLNNDNVPVRLSCQTLGVSKSGYYAWRGREPSERDSDNVRLLQKIGAVHCKSRGTYGYPRVHEELKADGESCSKNRVARLMKTNGICAVTTKFFKVQTTNSNHRLPVAERVFEIENVDQCATEPNKVWAGDITYVPTDEGWVFLAIFLDVCTRKIVGHASSDHMRAELVLEALEMALGQQAAGAGLIAHTDQGCQYASGDYRQRLSQAGIVASMSRKGNCYDNAFAESFFHSLKMELVYQRGFKTRDEARRAIFEYIEVWYNRQRRHSSLGYLSPVDYEQRAFSA